MDDQVYADWMRLVPIGSGIYVDPDVIPALVTEARRRKDLEGELSLLLLDESKEGALIRRMLGLIGSPRLDDALAFLARQRPRDVLWHALFRLSERAPEWLEQIEAVLDRWPDAMRPMPRDWWARITRGEDQPCFRLARNLGLAGEALTPAALAQVAPGMRWITELDLESAAIDDDTLAAILDRSELAGLRRLSLARNRITSRGAALLARGEFVRDLKWLNLTCCDELGPQGAAVLIAKGGLNNLHHLDLSACKLDFDELAGVLEQLPPRQVPLDLVLKQNTGGVARLCGCRALLGIRGLDLFFCPLNVDDAKALASSPHLMNLKRLAIGDAGIGRKGVRALLAAPWIACVEELNLSCQNAGDEIANDFHKLDGSALRKLEFRHNAIGRRTGQVLGKIRLSSLEELDLSYNALGDDALVPVVGNPSLGRLRILELRCMNHDVPRHATAAAVAGGTHLGSLKQLVIGGQVGDTGAKLIAGAAHLSTLRVLALGGVTENGHAALGASPYLRDCVIHDGNRLWSDVPLD